MGYEDSRASASGPPEVVVLGASGFVGSATCDALLRAGFSVRRVVAPRLSFGAHRSDWEASATTHPETGRLEKMFSGATAVVNAAGVADPDADDSDELHGANALLPAVVALAAGAAGVARVIHLSSAAVQGSRPVLDESEALAPFSPYSRSKARGERAFRSVSPPGSVVVRATSVQGLGRRTTENLRRMARSPFSSVASPGTQPTCVSSIDGLSALVAKLCALDGEVPRVVLQPWEGLSVRAVLEAAGGRRPVVLPARLCHTLIRAISCLAKIHPPLSGAVRRLELMWFGQRQAPGFADRLVEADGALVRILSARRG